MVFSHKKRIQQLNALLEDNLHTKQARERLLGWLMAVRAKQPRRYDATWRHHMAQLDVQWPRPFAQAHSLDELAQLGTLLPEAVRFELKLAGRQSSLTDLVALGTTPGVSQLIGLDVYDINLGFQGAVILAGLPQLTSLEVLYLGCNDIQDRGFAAICDSPHLKHLKHLSSTENGLSAMAVESFKNSEMAANIVRLNLSDNALGDLGIQHLGETHFTSIRALLVANNGLTARSLLAMIESPWLSRLHLLNLNDNPLGADALQQFVCDTALGNLTSLALNRTGFDDRCVDELRRSERLAFLKFLGLTHNLITDRGARALAQARYLTRLETLLLEGNIIGAEGLRALANSRYLPMPIRRQFRP